jgi:hypothetical protein
MRQSSLAQFGIKTSKAKLDKTIGTSPSKAAEAQTQRGVSSSRRSGKPSPFKSKEEKPKTPTKQKISEDDKAEKPQEKSNKKINAKASITKSPGPS